MLCLTQFVWCSEGKSRQLSSVWCPMSKSRLYNLSEVKLRLLWHNPVCFLFQTLDTTNLYFFLFFSISLVYLFRNTGFHSDVCCVSNKSKVQQWKKEKSLHRCFAWHRLNLRLSESPFLFKTSTGICCRFFANIYFFNFRFSSAF